MYRVTVSHFIVWCQDRGPVRTESTAGSPLSTLLWLVRGHRGGAHRGTEGHSRILGLTSILDFFQIYIIYLLGICMNINMLLSSDGKFGKCRDVTMLNLSTFNVN